MTWNKREAVTNLVVLGDEDGQKKRVAGLLLAMPRDTMFPEKVNYEIMPKDGEPILLSGSASLSRQINEGDIGKFLKCEFTGWGRSANGKFKMIDVNVWEGEATDEMKKWPGYIDFQPPKKNATPPKAKGKVVEDDDFDEMPHGIQDDDSSLPF